MTPKQRRAWVKVLERTNAGAVARLELALLREFHTVVAEWQRIGDVRVLIDRHHRRLDVLLPRHLRDVAVRFGAAGRGMLAGTPPLSTKAADESRITGPPTSPPPNAHDVLRIAAAAVIGEGLAQRAATVLSHAPPAVEAATNALALYGEPVRAAASLAADPRFAAAVNEAALFGVAGPQAVLAPAESAGGGSGAGRPPTPPNPPAPPGGGSGPQRRSFGQRVEAHVRYWAPRRARKVAEGSEQIIRRALEESVRLGESEAQTAKRLNEALGLHSRWRAARIARTEIGAAQNAAILFTADGAQRPVVKVWAAIDDARTRPTHHQADGQAVPVNEAFLVGTAALMHPGDPDGPLGEIINCRCAMLLEPA